VHDNCVEWLHVDELKDYVNKMRSNHDGSMYSVTNIFLTFKLCSAVKITTFVQYVCFTMITG
jgi:hypothetical protein